MGKRIRVQRRGRGSPTFRASSHKHVAPTRYPRLPEDKIDGLIKGQILTVMHDPGRGSPIALIELEDGSAYYSVVPEGVYEGQIIELGGKAAVRVGNVLPIGRIPEGTMVCNVELKPGDGGKLVRSSGTYATVISHTPEGTLLKMPSGKTCYINDECLATIGVVAASGRIDKPFMKAGAKYYWMKAKGRKYPRTRGRAMAAVVHPFGSGRRGGRKPSTVSRGAPPGRKVGLISARRTGKKKK
ncbi:MAG: 50S ribosomal protein L2 [Nitrososphaerota archaeon]|nr:50S ribosomal protein L2 [Candidatus Bathyarchaeota archaeon]MDW8048189.1 50S ribosomal protein L2 [Nitrososphaerota archaeon]